MQKNLDQTVGCTDKALISVSRSAGLTRVMGVILLFVLLYQSSHALGATSSVTLGWDRSAGTEATGYRLYYGVASRNYTNSFVMGNVTNGTIPDLVVGATYFFTVAAYNSFGLESTFSNEVNFIVPGGLAKLQISITANKQAILTVTGKANHTYEIQVTPDLKTWAVIGSVTLGVSGSVNYTNANAGSFAKRFYRVRDTQP